MEIKICKICNRNILEDEKKVITKDGEVFHLGCYEDKRLEKWSRYE